MQPLVDLWMESNSKERDVIIMAFWYTGHGKSVNKRAKEFLNFIVTKEDRVLKVMHQVSMATNIKTSLGEDDLNNMDVYGILGIDPYIHVMLDFIGGSMEVFKKAVKLSLLVKE